MRGSSVDNVPVEALEGRLLLTVFTVTNGNDDGPGSLRWALTSSNNTPGIDTIAFNLPGADKTIRPTSPLPIVYDPARILGTTQPGYAGKPLVRIDGSAAGATDGIELFGNCTLKGLCITGFNGQAVTTIPIANSGYGGNLIRGNWIGVDLKGDPAPNQSSDLGIYSPANVIDGNVLGSSIAGDGIWMMGGIFNSANGGNVIENNLIGLDPTGAESRGAIDGIGIQDSPDDIVINNVIGNQRDDGILLRGTASRAIIRGNLIGTDKTGTVAMRNGLYGIEDQSDHGLIGGLRARQRNVISNSGVAGIVFWLSGAHDNIVQGNLIGTDITGTKAMGNAEQGIAFSQAGPNLIGGLAAGAANIICANRHEGIGIFPGSGEIIEGNRIGVNAVGGALGNGSWGVDLFGGSTDCVIGGTVAGASNWIANNPSGSVLVGDGAAIVTGNITALPKARHRHRAA